MYTVSFDEILARRLLPNPERTSINRMSVQSPRGRNYDFVRVMTEDGPEWFVRGKEPKPVLRKSIPASDKFQRHLPRKLPTGEYILPVEPGFIYLIYFDGLYKIGMTKDINQRMEQLNRRWKMNNKYKIIHVIATEDMLNLELEFHRKFADKCIHSEWFDLSEHDVAYIVQFSSM